MAYIQDISVLMRELLKVPKDYTPTAIEISKYIRSRYSNDQIENMAKRPMGSRGFSSASRSAPPRVVQEMPRPQPVQQPPKPIHLVNRHQKMSGRSLNYSTLQPNEKAKQQPYTRKSRAVPDKVEKKAFTTTAPRKAPARRNVQPKDVWDRKPNTAPPPITPVEPLLANRQSFWNWKSAKNHIRRAMSDLVVSSPVPKNKLALLSEKIKLDPKIEEALEAKRKGMLRDMVDPDVTEKEPLRTREIIQRLLEENKLEDQRREIARLTEMARATVLQARKSNFVSNKTRKRRDERF